jgi:hypothetical protein
VRRTFRQPDYARGTDQRANAVLSELLTNKKSTPTSLTQSTAAHAVAPKRRASDTTERASGSEVQSYVQQRKRPKPMQFVSLSNNTSTHDQNSNNTSLNKEDGDSGEDLSHDISASREHRWANLLGRRPDAEDGDGMSAWLLEVMTVSDLKKPLTNAGGGLSSLTAGNSFNPFSTDAREEHSM